MRFGIVNMSTDWLVLVTTPKTPLKKDELSKTYQVIYRENLLQFRPEKCCPLEYDVATNFLYIYTTHDDMKHNLKIVNKLFFR